MLRKPSISVLLLFLSLVVAFLLYRGSFGAYFFQDDWFTLKIGRASTISEFFRFFLPRQDVIYYRPLGMQVPFYLLSSLFGMSAFPFHVVTFLTLTFSVVIVYFLVLEISGKKFIALLSSVLYATSAIHYTPFYWSSTYSFMLGPLIFFSSFWLFLRCMKKENGRIYLVSFLLFIMGIFTNEIVAVYPLIVFSYLLFQGKVKEKLQFMIPFFLFTALFLSSRFLLFPPPTQGVYRLSVGSYILGSIRAYFLWSFNWPEELKAQFISLFRLNPLFIQSFPREALLFVSTFLFALVISFVGPIAMQVIYIGQRIPRTVFFGGIWFLIGLLPVLFFPDHSYSYYLPISEVGLLLAISTLLYQLHRMSSLLFLRHLALFIFLECWLIASFTTVAFNEKVHWAPRRASLSRYLVLKIQKEYPLLPYGGTIYLDPSSEFRLALNDQDALDVLYPDLHLKTIYGYKD